MDYVVGSVAALISGNVTPNRPKLIRRALTPTKHQPSPNVTPKSEFVEDRSIFLSPTQQKKNAIVKKSPKRIFQNADLDITEDSEGNSSLTSPKAERVKKHLKQQLEADNMDLKKSPGNNTVNKSSDDISPKKRSKILDDFNDNDSTPSKKKKKRSSKPNIAESVKEINDEMEAKKIENPNNTESNVISKKNKKRLKSISELSDIQAEGEENVSKSTKKLKKIKTNKDNVIETPGTQQMVNNTNEKKKNKKHKKKKNKIINKSEDSEDNKIDTNKENNSQDSSQLDKQNHNKKKKNNRKNKSKQTKMTKTEETETQEEKIDNEKKEDQSESETEEVKSKNIPNPNAITQKDSDSEHDSDDEIKSDNEEANEKILTNETAEQEQSTDEEDAEQEHKKNEKKTEVKKEVISQEEIKRTLFVGNVPFSNKCKKEIKKIFSKYGQIDTIRIRTIPVKDARVTPKLAVIKNELHPERTTVNVYVKYAEESSVNKALKENNTTLNGYHLRVSRSDSTGAEHDPHCAVFVGNLPFGIEDDTLRSKFENCGEIASVRVIRDKKTNAGKGFGYVNFATKDGVELALALSEEDLTIKNRIIRVKRCTQAQSQGKRPGGKFNSGGKFNNGGKFNSGGYFNNGGKFNSGGYFNNGGKFNSGGNFNNGGKFNSGGNFNSAGKYNSGGNFGGGGRWGNQTGQEEGAARRVMHKRKQQESAGDGPPNKKQNINQPSKEKKPRKEFVGMTAEKKKKHKFNKGLKKKKALSEILTKKRD